PVRWPGSWHRKGQPRLCRIRSITENEVDLDWALQRLAQLVDLPEYDASADITIDAVVADEHAGLIEKAVELIERDITEKGIGSGAGSARTWSLLQRILDMNWDGEALSPAKAKALMESRGYRNVDASMGQRRGSPVGKRDVSPAAGSGDPVIDELNREYA